MQAKESPSSAFVIGQPVSESVVTCLLPPALSLGLVDCQHFVRCFFSCRSAVLGHAWLRCSIPGGCLGLIRLVDYLSQPSCFGKEGILRIVVDCGTGTTAVGLALGILLFGYVLLC